MAANFGRDADTIAGMVGGLTGALHGAAAIPGEWIDRVEAAGIDYQAMTQRFIAVIRARREEEQAVSEHISQMLRS